MSSSRTIETTTTGYSAREREIVAALTALRPQAADPESRMRAKDRLMLVLAADRATATEDTTRSAGRIAS